MKPQQYSNHTKFYTPHHFIFFPLALAGIIISVRGIFTHQTEQPEWIMITALWVMVTWTSFMLRQHYSLGNQNRIIRIEMRFRYYALTQQRLELLEDKLSFGQIAALRFASDEELPALVKRTVSENLSPGDIKKSIKNWLPDHMRV
jgi:hypothetical protein